MRELSLANHIYRYGYGWQGWQPSLLSIQGVLRIKLHKNTIPLEQYISLAGGRIHAFRYQALSKRSKLQCKKAAIKGKYVCMFHGGKSTGPVTLNGKRRCSEVKTIHGRETRAIRTL